MVILYFIICLFLITIGALTKNFNYEQLFILPIGVIAILFQKFIHRGKIKDLGFRKCKLKQILEAIIFPLVIIFLIFLIDFIFGFIKIQSLSELKNPFIKGQIGIDIGTLMLIILITALLTFIGALITEELAFRGYLITRLNKLGDLRALIYSSLLFGIWHIPVSAILLGTGAWRSVIYAFNIFLLGILFGNLFLESKSLIPPSLFHGVWNSLEYTLFGFGNAQAIFLGSSRIIFDPEEGFVGTIILIAFSLIALWKIRMKKVDVESSKD
ncbi:MAG: lysostaphin resistance A-like protein [Candidatus Aminicenantia bacterium]